MYVLQTADRAYQLRYVQSSHLKSLVASMRTLALDYHDGMKTVMSSAQYNPKDSSTGDSVAEEYRRKIVKQGFKKSLLEENHRCSIVYQLNGEDGQERFKLSLCVIKVIPRNG